MKKRDIIRLLCDSQSHCFSAGKALFWSFVFSVLLSACGDTKIQVAPSQFSGGEPNQFFISSAGDTIEINWKNPSPPEGFNEDGITGLILNYIDGEGNARELNLTESDLAGGSLAPNQTASLTLTGLNITQFSLQLVYRSNQGETTSQDIFTQENPRAATNTDAGDIDDDGKDNDEDACPFGVTGRANADKTDMGDWDNDGCRNYEDEDDDNDGVNDVDQSSNVLDLCPRGSIAFTGPDADGDGCEDTTEDPDDGTGEPVSGTIPLDADGDGVNNEADVCPFGETAWTSDGGSDYDSDGCRDATEDTDDDNDGLVDGRDTCPRGAIGVALADTTDEGDWDGDGCRNNEDENDDNDIANDSPDVCPFGAIGVAPADTSDIGDWDNDGCRNYEDPNDDNDALNDIEDMCPRGRIDFTGPDNDGDGCEDTTEDPDGGTGEPVSGTIPPDADADGVNNEADVCPFGETDWTSDESSDHDGDGCRDATAEDTDDDNDGLVDGRDTCPRGAIGVALADTTDEGDWDNDGCRNTEDSDDDNDLVDDGVDVNCQFGAIGVAPADESDIGDLDRDGCRNYEDPNDDNDDLNDLAPSGNPLDMCPRGRIDFTGPDADGDGCEDTTEDPDGGSGEMVDNDNDGIDDGIDNCLGISNSMQLNHDAAVEVELKGDACDEDDDNDGLNDRADMCPRGNTTWTRNSGTDNDGDGCQDATEDADDDNDGVDDLAQSGLTLDNCPLTPNPRQDDLDKDRIGDVCDTDNFNEAIVPQETTITLNWRTNPAPILNPAISSFNLTYRQFGGSNQTVSITRAGDLLSGTLQHTEDHSYILTGLINNTLYDILLKVLYSDDSESVLIDAATRTGLNHDDDHLVDDLDPDDDNDSVNDGFDACPRGDTGWESASDTDNDGDGCQDATTEDQDDDNDGVEDSNEAAGTHPTSGKACSLEPDCDNDGTNDREDAFPLDALESVDTDGDRIGDNADNCITIPNNDQDNFDSDDFGDACDLDIENNGLIEISNQNQLDWIRYNLDGDGLRESVDAPNKDDGCPSPACNGFELTQDISLTGSNWSPIGHYLNIHGESRLQSFSAMFDGKGHRITNININRPNQSDIGLFAFTDNAEIRNLTLEFNTIAGDSYVGSLVGRVRGGSIDNVIATGEEVTGAINIGGLVGGAAGRRIKTEISSSNLTAARLYSSGGRLGGLLGEVQYDDDICDAEADDNEIAVRLTDISVKIEDIRSDSSSVGGVLGSGSCTEIGSTTASFSTMEGRSSVGGIAGSLFTSSRIVSSVTNGTSILAEEETGGMIGVGAGFEILSSRASTTEIEASGDIVGGLVGTGADYRIINSSAHTFRIRGDDGIGGLLGDSSAPRSVIRSSYSETEHITATGFYVGGLVGFGDRVIIHSSYAQSYNITGSSTVGGLAGYFGSFVARERIAEIYASNSTISASYAITTHINAHRDAGGIGSVSGLVASMPFTGGTIVSSYAITFNITGTIVNGLIGTGGISIYNSYAVTDSVTASSSFYGIGSGSSLYSSYWNNTRSNINAIGSGNQKLSTLQSISPESPSPHIYDSWNNATANIFINGESTPIGAHFPKAVWCDENLNGRIDTEEKREDNKVWNFGTENQLPALECALGGSERQRMQHSASGI